jgi:hypothetical protein
VIIGAVVVLAVLALVSRSRRANDGVDSFRRQIDALSPEARRPVIDQIQNAQDRNDSPIDPRIELRSTESGAEPDSPGDGAPDAGSGDDEAETDDSDEDGDDGT